MAGRGVRAGVMLIAVLSLTLPGPVRAETDAAALSDSLAQRLGNGSAHALIIGVSRFDAGAWPYLAGVPSEVAQVTAALQEQGFTPHFPVVDDKGRLNKPEIRDAVRRFAQDFGDQPENRLVIYFATHGMKEPGGKGLLIASDSLAPEKPGFPGSAYSVDELSDDLAGLQARHLFIFVNACFSGSMLPAMGSGSLMRGAGPLDKAEADPTLTWAMRLLEQQAWLVLTAGSDDQKVPDRGNPFATAVAEGLGGRADLDGDGLILGSEIAQHVRSSVALATLETGQPNDPVFAVLGQGAKNAPAGLIGDFVFIAPQGPADKVGRDAEAVVAARNARLPDGQFTECPDCPVMVTLPSPDGLQVPPRLAMGRTEVSYSEWDACYREFSCRFLQDDGNGRGNRPAAGVTWSDALDFVDWMNLRRGARCDRYRLPALDEWQAAAADSGSDEAVCRDCGSEGGASARSAAGTGSLTPNLHGLYDMAGNLWEWVEGDAPGCSRADLAASGRCDQDGIVAGGAFSTRSREIDAAMAGATYPRLSYKAPDGRTVSALPTVGLRIACDLAREG